MNEKTKYRDDPIWQEAQRRYISDYPGLDPDIECMLRILAALEMYLIQHAYKTGTNPESPAPFEELRKHLLETGTSHE